MLLMPALTLMPPHNVSLPRHTDYAFELSLFFFLLIISSLLMLTLSFSLMICHARAAEYQHTMNIAAQHEHVIFAAFALP